MRSKWLLHLLFVQRQKSFMFTKSSHGHDHHSLAGALVMYSVPWGRSIYKINRKHNIHFEELHLFWQSPCWPSKSVAWMQLIWSYANFTNFRESSRLMVQLNFILVFVDLKLWMSQMNDKLFQSIMICGMLFDGKYLHLLVLTLGIKEHRSEMESMQQQILWGPDT